MKRKIVFTGGGTAGHVTPNIALIESMSADDWEIQYVGSYQGVEKVMIQAINIPYHAIRCGKLRRYFSWQNFYDPFNMLIGILQSYWLLRRIKPHVVFSKGGFVALPVVIGAWLNRISVIAHESDMTPGLANRLSFPFVDKICVTFDAAKRHFKQQNKVVVTGTPIRHELLKGEKPRGLALCGFNTEKPCLLVMGGSQGSSVINDAVRQSLDELGQHFQVIHLCGKGKVEPTLIDKVGYCQFEYANAELADLFAASDMVISRAGANALYEILVLEKPHVLIPLPLKSSRGDQIQNARYFSKLGISSVIDEEQLTPQTLMHAINQTNDQYDAIVQKIQALNIRNATQTIIDMLLTTALACKH